MTNKVQTDKPKRILGFRLEQRHDDGGLISIWYPDRGSALMEFDARLRVAATTAKAHGTPNPLDPHGWLRLVLVEVAS